MTFRLNYRLPVEGWALEKTTMDENNEKEFVWPFYKDYSVHPKSNMLPAIETTAHRAVLQDPK